MRKIIPLILLTIASLSSFGQGATNDSYKGITTGTNSYSVTINAITATAPYDGQKIWIKPGATNTGASTLKLSGSGFSYSAIGLTNNGSALSSGDIVAGQWYELIYSSALAKWQVQKPGGAGSFPDTPLFQGVNSYTATTVIKNNAALKLLSSASGSLFSCKKSVTDSSFLQFLFQGSNTKMFLGSVSSSFISEFASNGVNGLTNMYSANTMTGISTNAYLIPSAFNIDATGVLSGTSWKQDTSSVTGSASSYQLTTDAGAFGAEDFLLQSNYAELAIGAETRGIFIQNSGGNDFARIRSGSLYFLADNANTLFSFSGANIQSGGNIFPSFSASYSLGASGKIWNLAWIYTLVDAAGQDAIRINNRYLNEGSGILVLDWGSRATYGVWTHDSLSIHGAGGLRNLENITDVADDGFINIPDGKSGWGYVISINSGTPDEHLSFTFGTDGQVYPSYDASINSALTDTDGNLCVFDAGTNVRIRNRLGGTRTLKYEIHY